MASIVAKAASWARRAGVSAHRGRSASASVSPRHASWMNFGDGLLAEHQVRQHDRVDREQEHQLLLELRDLVGHDHGYARERELERHRPRRRGARPAPCGRPRAWPPRRGRWSARRASPAPPSSTSGSTWSTAGKVSRISRPSAACTRPIASPKGAIRRRTSERRLPGSTRSSSGPSAIGRRSPGAGRSAPHTLDQRVADIGAGRPAEAQVRGRLEGLERHHVVDIGSHRLGPPRPPGPDRRRDVVDHREPGQPLCGRAGRRGG